MKPAPRVSGRSHCAVLRARAHLKRKGRVNRADIEGVRSSSAASGPSPGCCGVSVVRGDQERWELPVRSVTERDLPEKVPNTHEQQ